MRHSLGTAVFAGMFVTVFGVVLTPVFFTSSPGSAVPFRQRRHAASAACWCCLNILLLGPPAL